MSDINEVRKFIERCKDNELFIASDIYRQSFKDKISELSYYKILERLNKDNIIIKISKGIYAKPKYTKYGVVTPTENDIVEKFTRDESGMVIGYYLYNMLRLTTQISKNKNILTCNIDSQTKTISNVNMKRVNLKFTEEIKNVIIALEVLQNFDYIEDLNYLSFISFSEFAAKVYDDKILKIILKELSYKKRTLSFYKEILDYYRVDNNISDYLSSLSNYKHPRMEDINEIARRENNIW